MPARLHRGQMLVAPDGSVHNVRWEREPVAETRTGSWRWRQSPFSGTRELNGLRVVMALINNGDLKDQNNAVYQDGPERIYMVSDLGASFGSAGRSWPGDKDKDNFDSYSHSKFIRKITADFVDFQAPARPMFVFLVNPKEYFSRIRLEWVGRHIPRDDARWIGRLLARLSPRQIRDAFRAAGYSPQDVERFSGVVANRFAAFLGSVRSAHRPDTDRAIFSSSIHAARAVRPPACESAPPCPDPASPGCGRGSSAHPTIRAGSPARRQPAC
jgi:hypothetical protein